MLGRSSAAPWETVFSTSFERMERVTVVGGWVYRSWVIFGSDSHNPGFSMIFVPKGDPIAPVNIDIPAVTGVGAVGEVLTCTTGNWANEPTSYSYEWTSKHLSTLEEIKIGADENTYTVTEADTGKAIICTVTATNAAGSTVAPPSNAIVVS